MSLHTIQVANLKALRSFEWSPSGVSVLVGPNGSGKTTALRVLQMLQTSLERGYDEGLRVFGNGPLRHLDAEPHFGQPEVSIRYADTTWRLTLDRDTSEPNERADRGDFAVFARARRPNHTAVIRHGTDVHVLVGDQPNRLVLGQIEQKDHPELHALKVVLLKARYYSRPALEFLRLEGSTSSIDVALDTSARNLFTVLRNWRDKSEHEHRYQFVLDAMGECFPDFRRLDFANWGPRVGAELPLSGRSEKLPPSDWSDGFMTMLCHFAAIASVDDGGIVGIDEPENSLHPELIAKLFEAMRDWSRRRQVAVVLATHSPVVLDQFGDEPEQVLVMQPGREKLPVALTDLKKRDWLKHFSLGDLYSHLEVGAP